MLLEFILIHKAARDSRKKNLCDFADVCCPLSDIRCLMSEDCCLHVCLSVCLSDIYLCDDWYLTSAVLSAPLFAVCCLTSWDIFCLMSAVYCLICYVCYPLAPVFCLMPLLSDSWMSARLLIMLCLLSAVCCLMSLIWYRMSTFFRLLFDVCCLLSPCLLIYFVCYLLFVVWCLLSDTGCLLSDIICLLSAVYVCCLYVSWLWCLLHTCLMSDVKWRGILPVIRPFISHRILLSYKESHKMKTGSIGVSG